MFFHCQANYVPWKSRLVPQYLPACSAKPENGLAGDSVGTKWPYPGTSLAKKEMAAADELR